MTVESTVARIADGGTEVTRKVTLSRGEVVDLGELEVA